MTLGIMGDACDGRSSKSTVVALFLVFNILLMLQLMVRNIIVNHKLVAAKSFQLKKPSTQVFIAGPIVELGIIGYQFSLLMIILKSDPVSFFKDRGRAMFISLSVLFTQFVSLSVAITWISIAGAGGKRGKVELPLSLKIAKWTCEFLKVLTLIVLGVAGATGNAQILRVYTVLQVILVAVFYYFGGKMIAKILMPDKRGEGVTDEAWAKQCEPALKIKSVSKRCCIASIAYVFFQVASSPIVVQNKDPTKAFLGMCLFLTSVGPCAAFLLTEFFQYCCFGSRKALKTGKVASFGAASTASTMASSVD
ncbi:hypothetical protein TrVE_jg8984 [Triparma verrucosa]|uniref:Uncharacterized protein n=1 Tax=Triparma verrucosa TaxID=1606542 RepID=A0A9W7EVK1_9STRA|nr:hypothetical protein TrVE_jg8984 [Triparma verrucosa]